MTVLDAVTLGRDTIHRFARIRACDGSAGNVHGPPEDFELVLDSWEVRTCGERCRPTEWHKDLHIGAVCELRTRWGEKRIVIVRELWEPSWGVCVLWGDYVNFGTDLASSGSATPSMLTVIETGGRIKRTSRYGLAYIPPAVRSNDRRLSLP
jgi:hypothetical protein